MSLLVLGLIAGCASRQAAPAHDAHSLVVSPSRIQAVIGTPVTFRVGGEGGNTRYQWQTKLEHEPATAWRDVPGANRPQATFLTEHAYQFCQTFRVRVHDGANVRTSRTAVLINQLPAPHFTEDLPTDLTVAAGSSATLQVSTDSASYYRWQRDGKDVTGGSFEGATYHTHPLSLSDEGAQLWVEAVNFAGNHQCTQAHSARSRTVTLHVRAQ